MDVLNRQSFQQLAATRLEDAKILIANERFAGAFYLAGYVVECGLKACICRLTREHDFPDKKRASDSHSHSLVKLFDIAQVPEDKLDADPELQRNWALAYNKLVCRDAIWRSDEHGSRQPVAVGPRRPRGCGPG